MRNRAALGVIAVVTTTLVPLVGGAALAGTDDGTPGIAVESPTPAGFTPYGALRFRSVGSTNQGDEYLGVADLGVGTNRIESNFNNGAFSLGGNPGSRSGDCEGAYNIGSSGSPASNVVIFTWNKTADTLTTLFINPTLDCTMVFGPGFAQKLANARGVSLAEARALLEDVNALQVFIDDREAGNTIAFTGVAVDRTFAIGPFIGVPGGQKGWLGTGYDFDAPNGFTIAGALRLAGAFGGCNETCKLEIQFGNLGAANQPPTVDAGGPYSGVEGSPVAIGGAASDPDDDPLTYLWSYTADSGVDPGAACTFADATELSTTVTCTDDGSFTLTLAATDGDSATGSDTVDLTIANEDPSVTIDTPVGEALFSVEASVSLEASFVDPGPNDDHTCSIDWGDGTGEGDVSANACTASHTYVGAGVYSVAASVTDDDGGSGTDSVTVMVYDPSGGFVTGGGWIRSPAGASAAEPGLVGRANFGFVSKYGKGASVPEGSTEFRFRVGDLNFHSHAQTWLVVDPNAGLATFEGTGSINGTGDYGFTIRVTDGSADTFRIEIWDADAGGAVVYDSGVQALGGGSIVVHTR